jgi:Flp pilus assembly protein TadB
MTDDRDQPERPRVEPEIIPPGERRSDWRNSPWRNEGYSETRGRQRIYVTRIGPFGMALLVLAIAAIVAFVIVAALGLVLIWLPIVVVIVVAAALFRLLRGFGSR